MERLSIPHLKNIYAVEASRFESQMHILQSHPETASPANAIQAAYYAARCMLIGELLDPAGRRAEAAQEMQERLEALSDARLTLTPPT